MSRFGFIVTVAALLASAGFTFAQTAPAGIEKVASVEGVNEYRVANGLRVLLFPDPAKSTTTVNIIYFAGSRHENYGETGLAHLLEHLVSYGSPRHPDAKAEQAARGARRNASTWYDSTNYYESFPASDENLAWAIDLEADRMRNAFVKKEILESQMSVVRNEFEAGENSPPRILQQRIFSTAYLWHNYGKSTIGARADIENMPIERLQEFYDRYYQPNNAILIIAGKFEEPRSLELIAAKFGPVPSSTRTIPATYTAEPTQDGEREVTLRRAGDIQVVAAGYHIPAASHPDCGPLRVLMDALSGQPNGRLFKALVESKKAVSVSASARGLREAGYATITASVRKEQSLEETRTLLVQAIDALRSAPFTAEEVERSRLRVLRQIELGLVNSDTVSFALGEAAASGDWRLLFLERDWIRNTTASDVARVAAKYFVPSNRTLGVFIPETQPVRAEIPTPPTIESLFAGYKGDAVIAQGEAFDPSPENIDQRTIRAALPGGLKLALLPKQTRGGVVHAELQLHFGDAQSLKGKRHVSTAAASMLMRGTKNRTRQQISDEITRLKARMIVGGGAGSLSVSIETVRASLPDVLRLAAEVLREPAFSAAEYEQLQQQRLATYEEQRSDPQTLASLHLQRHFNPYPSEDPRSVPLPDESLAAVRATTLDQVKAFWQEFAGASNAELAVVGDFDPAELQPLVAKLFGEWRSPKPYQAWRRAYGNRPVVNVSLPTPDKQNAMFVAGMLLPVSDEHADYPALVLANYMLGGHSASRLYLRIRGKEGLSYGVGSQVSAAMGDTQATFSVYAIANPSNTPKVEEAFRDEIARALREGFAADEVATAKNGWSQSRRVTRSSDVQLVDTLQLYAEHNRTMAFAGDLERKVNALTVDQVTAVLRKYIAVDQISIVKAGDFKTDAAGK